MLRDELDFCKECGMELAVGEDQVCPLCGAEVSGSNQDGQDVIFGNQSIGTSKCDSCGEPYDEDDEWFWDYWTDFDGPEWLSMDYVWCSNCIINRFKKDHSDFENSGLQPDTYLVWREALGVGIDLGPKLSEIELSDSIRRLWYLDREELIRWLATDCSIDEIESWRQIFDEGEFDNAMAWRNAGFQPEGEVIEGWREWGCSPIDAVHYVSQGQPTAPWTYFRDLGVSLADAVFYEQNDMDGGPSDSGRYRIAGWLFTGLTPSEIVELRNNVVEQEAEFVALCSRNARCQNYNTLAHELWDAIPQMIITLQQVRLPVSVENLKKYWGFSGNEILSVIDAGGSAGQRIDLVRQGVPVNKFSLVERLMEMGVTKGTASLFARRGFQQKHIKSLDGYFDVRSASERLGDILMAQSSMPIDEALIWFDTPMTGVAVKQWTERGLDAQTAIQWHKEGFRAGDALQWIDAGVASPIVAKRRRDAGIEP